MISNNCQDGKYEVIFVIKGVITNKDIKESAKKRLSLASESLPIYNNNKNQQKYPMSNGKKTAQDNCQVCINSSWYRFYIHNECIWSFVFYCEKYHWFKVKSSVI